MDTRAILIDLAIDFHNEDETGCLWTWPARVAVVCRRALTIH